MSETPTLASVLLGAIHSELAGVHVSMPARVTEYDATTQSVSAKPLINRTYRDENDVEVNEELPIVNHVPVSFPGANAYRVTFPIIPGDIVLLVFSEASLDKWLKNGGLVDPLDNRRHSLSDAMAIPGINPFSDPLVNAPTDRMSMGNDDEDTGINGPPTIEIDRNEIRIGDNDASEYAALQSEVKAIRDALDGHTHSYLSGGSGAATTTSNPAVPDPVGARKVKVR